MKKNLVDAFFDLNQYSHSKVFAGCANAWEPLCQIEVFFQQSRLGQIECEIPEGVFLVNPELISIAEDTRIEPGVFIQGPCLIGKGCEVRSGAYIRRNVIVGDHCVIGHGTEVKHSILLDEVYAAHFNYIGDSILGNRVNLGAGVKLANLRLDRQEILVICEGKKLSTNLKKLGAIIGDDAQLGCNAVVNPGSLIEKGFFCPPLQTLTGYVQKKV